jgi:hypothetical protein
MKCLDVVLNPGQTINIPAYWWYSIQFEKETCIACFRYRTYMNNAAIVPHIAMHALQLQNVKREVVKKHDIKDLNNKGSKTSSLGESSLEQKNEQDEPVKSDEIPGAESTSSINNSEL